MSFEELECGKWYKAFCFSKFSKQRTDLFQFKGIDKDLTDDFQIVIDFIRGISVTEDTIDINKGWGVYSYTDSIEEVDESLVYKVIKQFNITKAAVLATIN